MAQAYFIMPFIDFDYPGWAEQLGLSVMKDVEREDGCRDFIVEGHQDAIDQFEAELDFPAEEITDGKIEKLKPSFRAGPALLIELLNSFGRIAKAGR